MSKSILLIEDDLRLAEMIVQYLEDASFNVTHAPNGSEGLKTLSKHPEQAIILDLMLPDMDGLDICRQIRKTSQTPILMLTARGDAMDRVIGLELGADDYLPKPFEPRELLARLNAILRRSEPGSTDRQQATGDLLRFGRLEIDRAARDVRVNEISTPITGYQFDLLLALAEHAGRVLSREQIMDLVKGEELESFDRSIDVHISRIRQAIEDDPKRPKRIITVRGAGYVFAKIQDSGS